MAVHKAQAPAQLQGVVREHALGIGDGAEGLAHVDGLSVLFTPRQGSSMLRPRLVMPYGGRGSQSW